MVFRLLSILRWLVVAALLSLLVLPALIAVMPGWVMLQVDGRSMEPTYQLHDVIIGRTPSSDEHYVPGEVVAFQGQNSVVTHRVVAINPDGTLVVRGDANDVDDPTPVQPQDVRGIIVVHFPQPWATFVLELQGWPMRICLILLITGLSLLRRPSGGTRPTPDTVVDTDVDASGPEGPPEPDDALNALLVAVPAKTEAETPPSAPVRRRDLR